MLSISLCFFCLVPSPSSPSLCLALSLSMSLAFSSHLSPSPATFQKNELLWAVTWPWPRIHFCGSSVSNCHFWQEPSHIITTWMDLDFSFSLPLSHSLSSLSLFSSYAFQKRSHCWCQKKELERRGTWRVKSWKTWCRRDQYSINRFNLTTCKVLWGMKISRALTKNTSKERVTQQCQYLTMARSTT